MQKSRICFDFAGEKQIPYLTALPSVGDFIATSEPSGSWRKSTRTMPVWWSSARPEPGSATSMEIEKAEYLGDVASGAIDYRVWEPHEIDVRVCGDAGCIRYHSQLEIVVAGRKIDLSRYWHTDYYERRDGRWQGGLLPRDRDR